MIIRTKFTDEKTAMAALPGFIRTDANGVSNWITDCHGWHLTPICPMELVRAVVDHATMTVTTPAVLDNAFHLNIVLNDASLAAQMPNANVIVPVNPRVKVAGEP